MARLWYGGTPADFVVALGTAVTIPGSSPTADGRTALIPEDSVELLVYDADGGTQVTDLLAVGGSPITSLDSSDDLDSLGTIPRFQGPNGFTGDLYVSSDATVYYRLAPSTDDLFERVESVESSVTGLSLDDLVDVDTSGATDGQALVYDAGTGKFVADDAGTGSVSSVNGQTPTAGAVTLTPANIGAATAAGLTAVASIVGARLLQTGGGYPARPAGAQYVIYIGTATPITGVQDGDLWYQPATI